MRTFQSQYFFVSLSVCTLLIASCGDEHSKESLARPRILQANIVENHVPNQFSVALSWKNGAGEKYFLHRREPSGSGGILDLTPQIDQPTKSFHDLNVIPGNKYVYSLELASDRSSIFLEEVEIEIYKDVEVIGLTKAESLSRGSQNRFHRLFLRERSILLTGGEDLIWEIDELISGEGAAIYSFGEHTTNRVGRDGTAGGKIFINARKARGHLAIYGYGEDGGAGVLGKDGEDGPPGEKGEPGRCVTNAEFNKMNEQKGDDPFGEKVLRPRIPNKTSVSKLVLDVKPDSKLDPNSPFATHVCIKEPTDGRPGYPGQSGENGGKGGRGGDSAAVFVTVEDVSEFELKVRVSAGIPGIGGLPGKGGIGGKGGLPGDLDAKKICPSANAGEKGPDGGPGKIGERGDRGTQLPYCLRLGTRQEGDCASYLN